MPAPALVLALVLGPVLAAPAAAAPPTEAAARGGSYVALGDSFAAGPLIPSPTGWPPGCLRSTANYPSRVGAGLGTVVQDVSCSGATTGDLFTAQGTELGTNPPQLDAISAGTHTVTLTIGGNDIGFVSILTQCAQRSPQEPFGAACRDFYNSAGHDELATRIDETAPDIAEALTEIALRAPDADVLLVGYPALLPEHGHCFPVVPFSAGDVAYLRGVNQQLNAMLAEQASAAGVTYVDTYTPSIGHDMCAPVGARWIEGFVPTSPAAPVHPNALGMAGMARPVLATLQASVL